MWPSGIKCAVCLSFDFDAESLSLGVMERMIYEGDHRRYVKTLTPISRGQYGSRVGMPRILKFLEKHQIPATFFVPGFTADLYPDIIKEIVAHGHELANHGYYHENPTEFAGNPEKERDILRRGNDTLEKLGGSRPVGYRSPGWDLNTYSPKLLLEEGMLYDSSLMDDEVPYILFSRKETKLVELPIDWLLDDYVHFQFSAPTIQGLSAPSKVLEIWQGEFNGYLEAGGCFTLTMHPQVMGRSHRMQMLESLVQHMKRLDGVWFATCKAVAEYWVEQAEKG